MTDWAVDVESRERDGSIWGNRLNQQFSSPSTENFTDEVMTCSPFPSLKSSICLTFHFTWWLAIASDMNNRFFITKWHGGVRRWRTGCRWSIRNVDIWRLTGNSGPTDVNVTHACLMLWRKCVESGPSTVKWKYVFSSWFDIFDCYSSSNFWTSLTVF